MNDFQRDGSHLMSCAPVAKWDDWVEYDPDRLAAQSRPPLPTHSHHLLQLRIGVRLARLHQQGDRRQVDKFEGNPGHPASRGRVCAKGPAVINQITIPTASSIP